MRNEQVSQAPGLEAGKPAQSCPVSGGQSTRPILMTPANDYSPSRGTSVVSACHCVSWKWPLEAADCGHQLAVEELWSGLSPAAGAASPTYTQIYCSLRHTQGSVSYQAWWGLYHGGLGKCL